MVFSSLQENEKAAFFSLLDEYFSSRPEIFANVAGNQADTGVHASVPASSLQSVAGSAAHRAMVANPEATAKLFSAGLKHAANSASNRPPGTSATVGASDSNTEAATNAAGRFAAASLAFSGRNSNNSPSPSATEKPSPSLTTVRKIGDVDTSSAKNFFGSLRNPGKPPPPVAPPPPAAFAPRQNNFAPPPKRTVSATKVPSREPSPAPPPPPPAPARRNQPEPEEEEDDSEWLEAIYDYNSGEAGDLKVNEGDRILLIKRDSDDWWTGEINGRQGLFPASYVKAI